MENKEKKLLLQISNLKQYFPVGKGRFVRATDGITLDIYEGETFGLVGESGCGKSTLGRSILQLYKQTDGRTMYFGRSIDELAPKYAHDTFNSLVKRREKMKVKREKYAAFRAEYDKLEGAERLVMHGGGYSYLTAEAARYIVDSGIRCLVTDGWSPAPLDNEKEIHQMLLKAHVGIVENVTLDHVEDGDYTLLALPVNFGDSDGAPCRAVLLQE